MKSTIARKLDLARRSAARRPLSVLVQWVLVYATRPYLLADVERWMIEAVETDVRRLLLEMADAQVFSFFGIHNAEDFGEPPITLWMAWPNLLLRIDDVALTAWIMGGGARRAGWRAPSELDLEMET